MVLLFFPSPVGWRCLISSFLGVVFLSFYVVLLGSFPLWVVSPVWCCCLPSPPLGGAAFSNVFFLVSSLFGWSLLFGGAAFIRSFGCGSFFPCLLFGGAVWFHPSFWVVWLFFPSPVGWCCLVSSLFGWSLLFGGAAFLLLLWEGLLFSMSSVGWCCLVSSTFWVVLLFFLLLFGGAAFLLLLWVGWCCSVSSSFWWCCCFSFSCLVVLPSFSSFWWDCFIPRLLLGGAASPSFWVVLLCFPSPVAWCCLVSSFLDVVFLSFYVVLLGFFPLWLVSPVWWILSSPLGGAALSPVFCCVALLGLLLPRRCFPLLLRGAAWFLPSLGGLSCLVLLPSIPSSGQFHPSSVGWCCLVSSSFWVVLRFPSPFAWYFLVSSFLGVVFLCLYLGLLGFFTL